MDRVRTEIRTTCPRDCYDSCGMVVHLEDGRIRKVTGDVDHAVSRGSLCGKCALAYNGAWLDPERRLTQPLRRVGPKGQARFEATTWDAALGDIAGRLAELRALRGDASVLHTHYTGTCSAVAGTFPVRFFRAIGATEVDPDTVCNKAGHEALRYTIGDSFTGFDPRSASEAGCILVWGANPYASAPHAHRYWLPESPARKIVVDPIAHETARAADLFLQLRPGTDAALAFAMMNVAARDALLDLDFLAGHVLGWEAIAGDVERMTPERGASLTGVPAALIVEAARLYAEGPSLLWLGQGMQRQRMGGNAFRSAAALAAATGNFGKPGTGLLYLNGANTRGVDLGYVSAPHLSRSPTPSISHMDLASTLSDPARASALFCWNNNILASNPQQSALRAALARDSLLTVAIDIFPTDTTDYADYVLPAASFLEFDDVLFPYFQDAVSAVVKVTEPPGSALPNQEIFRRLADRMGLADPELFETDDSVISVLLGQAGVEGGFGALAEVGTVFPQPGPRPAFADLAFGTPSGKVEIASRLAEADGYPLVPFPHADLPLSDGALRVLSPASEWTMNSSYANDDKILRRLDRATVTLNPTDAKARDLEEGEVVLLHNATGRLSLTLRLSDDVPRGVALVPKGRWPKHDVNRANVNVLNPGEKSDIGESSSVHSVVASITSLRATAAE